MKATCKIVMFVIVLALGALAAIPVGATIYADSEAQFSGEQGLDGWQYMEWYNPNSADDNGYVANDAYELTRFDATDLTDPKGMWKGGNPMGTGFGAIGSKLEWTSGSATWPPQYQLWPVRRWTSTVSGQVYIYGTLKKSTYPYGNGILGFIYIDGVQKWTYDLSAGNYIGTNFQLQETVSVGSTIDFVLSPKLGDCGYDWCEFTAFVDSDPPPIPPGAITGEIVTGNYRGRGDLLPVEVILMQGGAEIAKKTVYCDNGIGTYTFAGLTPGEFEVSFEAAQLLKLVVTEVDVASGQTVTVDGPLESGDITGDNYVGTDDFSCLSANYDHSGN